jgi:hypothetical protein
VKSKRSGLKTTMRIATLGIVAFCVWFASSARTDTAIARTVSPGFSPNAPMRESKMATGTYLYFFPFVSVVLTCPTTPLPPIYWDPRLGTGPQVLPHLENVRIIPASVSSCQRFWRAVSVVFQDVNESGNDHSIYVTVTDENGNRIDGQTLQVFSDTGGGIFPDQPIEKPAGDPCNCNFAYPMYGDGYNVRILGSLPSDIVAGMIMPLKRHVNYRIIFQRTTNP